MPESLTASFSSVVNNPSLISFTQEGRTYLPPPEFEVMPGVKWGNFCKLYTPAFWKFLYYYYNLPEDKNTHRIGNSIIEEVVACILGGYGMPSELGLLAFKRLRDYCLIEPSASFKEINEALKEPFLMEDGSCKVYRFYNQKAYYIYSFISRGDLDSIPCHCDVELRQWLLTVAGIGPKTASWITRNWLQSENVAILDIHILRAGKLAGFFKETENVSKNYFMLEKSYITFCKALNVLPSNMDAVIWHYMKLTNRLALRALSYS